MEIDIYGKIHTLGGLFEIHVKRVGLQSIFLQIVNIQVYTLIRHDALKDHNLISSDQK